METRERNNFEKIISEYFDQKQYYNLLDKEIKEKRNFIESKLNELSLDIYNTDKYTAKIQYSNKISMDDDKIIEILKQNCKLEDLQSVIKTKEYVDYDALESLIYNNKIPAEKLEPAQTIKTIKSLYVKPIKKEKEDE